jgi:hypothetical protein
MAASDVGNLLTACVASLSSSTLLQLLDQLIEVKWPLKETEHSEVIGELLTAFFSGQASKTEKTLVLETVLCWFEQQDDPSPFVSGTDLPSISLLADLCSVTTDFTVDSFELMKLWLLYIYNSENEKEAVEATYDRFGEGTGPIVEAFRLCLPMPKRPYPCLIRAKQDPVRLLRYAVAGCKVLALRRANEWYQQFSSKVLQKSLRMSLETSANANPWRENHAEALFALRLHIRRDLATYFMNFKRPRRALQQLSNSATELCGRPNWPGEVFGLRHFLGFVGAGPMDVGYTQIRLMLYPLGEVILPKAYLFDFYAFVRARAYMAKQRNRRKRAVAWAALGRRYMHHLQSYYYGEGEVTDGAFRVVLDLMEDLHELYDICYFVLA